MSEAEKPPSMQSRAQAMMAGIRANMARLESCPGPHDFGPAHRDTSAAPFLREHTCTRCGGVLEARYVSWYRLGLKHGRM